AVFLPLAISASERSNSSISAGSNACFAYSLSRHVRRLDRCSSAILRPGFSSMTLAFNDVPSALCDQCFEQSANVKCLTVVLLQQAHKLVIPVDDRIFRFQRFGLMDKENCARRPCFAQAVSASPGGAR